MGSSNLRQRALWGPAPSCCCGAAGAQGSPSTSNHVTTPSTRVLHSVKKKDLNPVWDEDVTFTYETKLVSKLHLKKLTLKVKDKDKWGTDDTIGTVQVDLHTLATGPVQHVLPLRDGANVKGELCFSVEMEQEAAVEVNMKDVELSAAQFSALDGPIVLQYMYNRGEEDDSKGARTSRPSTTTHFPYLDILYLRTTYRELNGAYITLWVRAGKGLPGHKDGDVLARADIPLSTVITFTDGKSSDFDCTLSDPAGASIGQITGTIFFKNFPQFLQMLGGYHAADGVHQAQFVSPDVPNKPAVYIHDATGGAPAPAPAAAAASGGGGGASRWGRADSSPSLASAARLAHTGVQLLRASGQSQRGPVGGGFPGPAPGGFGGPAPGGYGGGPTPGAFGGPAPGGYGGGPAPGGYGGGPAPGGYGGGPAQGLGQFAPHGHAPTPGMPPGGYGAPQHGGMPFHGHGGGPPGPWHTSAPPPAMQAPGPGRFAALATATMTAQRMGKASGPQGALAAALGGMGSTPAPAAEPSPAPTPAPAPAPGGLPACWERCVDPASKRVYFKNHVYKGTEWQLPTQSRYTVTVHYAGPMGLELEQNFSGRERTGTPSGRRNSGVDSGAVVKRVLEGGQASQLPGNPLRVGHHLVAVNGQSAEGWTFANTLSVLQQTPRPMQLTFHDPYAVDPETARRAAEAAPAPAPAPAPSEGKTPSEGGPSGSDDWVTLTDAGSGKTFYMNTNTNQVSWTWPPGQ